MMDRGIKKWKPFNSVVPLSKLRDTAECTIVPTLSKDEINEFEELLKESYYTGVPIKVTYIDRGKEKNITGSVKKLDPVRKNIYLSNCTINFRQIVRITL